MAIAIKMPKMSDTMTEGVVRKWNYKIGDTVKSGDILAEVETDKATMDLENYEKGTILHFAINEGDAAPVDSIIAIVGAEGEDFKVALNAVSKTVEVKKDTVILTEKAPTIDPPVIQNNTHNDTRLKASPLAKKLAEEKGIDLTSVAGSAENGRIVKSDIENFKGSEIIQSANILTVNGEESFDEINVSQMRKIIAARLAESKFTAPHFYLTMEINMDKAMAARVAMNASGDVKISVNDMIVKASAISLRKHPWVNASWLGTKIRFNHHINIGVAMAVEDGLLVPVVRFADQKSLSTISSEVKIFNGKAKDKKLQPTDWAGNTFTISNLGMFGIEEFTAIINPPDACILAVGGVKETVGIVNGEIAKTNVMKVTLSCDHRVVDGVVGSKFLNTFKELLEEPVMMFV
ncbi:MAG: 2-oxo acid dehydrogenase subunit E2 [Bacteroidetes bacterium]|nr:2-oxo acid dehydrogenase subunit E2 [Bacteroidota bacterium]